MEALRILGPYCAVPLTHQNLTAYLQNYQRPNDKIRYWIRKGYLIPIVRGIYVVSEDLCEARPSDMLIANIIYGPSYISLEYALAYYQAIPESVVEISSVTTQRSKCTETPLGCYSYTHVPLPYYSYGIHSHSVGGQYALLASPEKALMDTVVCTRKLLFRSGKDARSWLSDMRLDEEWLAGLDLAHLRQLLEHAPKRESLQKLLNSLSEYVA